VTAAGVLVLVAFAALVAGFGTSSAALLWIAAVLAAFALALWVAGRHASADDPAAVPSGPAIGLRVHARP
jgi:hypothetical protein